MENDKSEKVFKLLEESQQLACDIINFVQKSDGSTGLKADQIPNIRAALAIAYTTMCAATDVSLHESIDMVMTIYKNTVVKKE